MNKKRLVKVLVGLVGMAALLAAVLAVIWVVLIFFSWSRAIREDEEFLQSAECYEPVARQLSLYCQSDQSVFDAFGELDYAWFPEPLRSWASSRACGWAEISSSGATLGLGGGLAGYYGYKLELDQAASSPDVAAWRLYSFHEGSARLLTTLTQPRSAGLSREQLIELVVAGYQSRLAVLSGEDQSRLTVRLDEDWARVRTIVALLRFGKAERALQSAQAWGRAEPDHWLPQFMAAHVRCRLGQVEPAAEEFSRWVESHPRFDHSIYLAAFNMRENRPAPALAAVRRAMEQPIVEKPTTEGNKFYLAFCGAEIAFVQRDYSLCAAICDQGLAKGPEEYWRPKFEALKAAAQGPHGDISATKEIDLAELFSPRGISAGDAKQNQPPSPLYDKDWQKKVGL